MDCEVKPHSKILLKTEYVQTTEKEKKSYKVTTAPEVLLSKTRSINGSQQSKQVDCPCA
jgi:hypothetical protein